MDDIQPPSPDEEALQYTEPPSQEKLQDLYQNYINTHGGDPRESEGKLTFEAFCSSYTESWWAKKKLKDSSDVPKSPAPIVIPTDIKDGDGTDTKPAPPTEPAPTLRAVNRELTLEQAAKIIQRAWRRHIDIQVYKYYRDLINFKSRGDPSLMLRCINPKEAAYLDSAAGIHIRFRLAGDRFPPNIYYKIFTHRTVVDMCANSPKDYTKHGTKLRNARDVHNKGNRVPIDDRSGWYKRIENNGWRLVSDRLITHAMSDPVTWSTSNKTVEFNHNKLQRKQDVERKKKKRKVEWMKKMYREGMLQAKTEDPEAKVLIEGAAAGMVATIEKEGSEVIQEWEVDELLDWTTTLNFEDYLTGWREIATSSNSEKVVEDKLKLFTSANDPFQITFGNTDSHMHDRDAMIDTRQSHKTDMSGIPAYHLY